jgi:hypothetical protein
MTCAPSQGRTRRADLDPVLRLGWAVLRIKRRVIGWDDDTDLCTIGTVPNRLRITDKIVLETIRDVCGIYGRKNRIRTRRNRKQITSIFDQEQQWPSNLSRHKITIESELRVSWRLRQVRVHLPPGLPPVRPSWNDPFGPVQIGWLARL